jgi:putative transposase
VSILTYKVRHDKDLSVELDKARRVAQFAIGNRQCQSSKDVKSFGLPSAISGQILRKYGRDRKAKHVKHAVLRVPGQSLRHDSEAKTIRIPCLGMVVPFDKPVEKVLSIELDKEFVYVACQIQDAKQIEPKGWIGIDRNSTGHLVVAALPNGKVLKLGAKGCHVSKKYRAIRKSLQKKGKTRRLKKIRRRESDIVRDVNHKISRAICKIALDNQWGIKLENLKGIRKTKNQRRRPNTEKQRKDKAVLHSWPFHQFGLFVEYKARLLGSPVAHVAPQWTSKECSKCGLLGTRNGKEFKCPHCGHVEHADVNAAFNIALRPVRDSMPQSRGEWVPREGSSDTPQWATA